MTFWAFDRCPSLNIDRDIAVQRFGLFLDMMVSSMKQSTIVCKGVFTIQWYICTLSLTMISLFVLQLSWKLWFFHLKKNIEKQLWGHSVTSSMTSSPCKYFFLHYLIWSFHLWCQIEAVFNIVTFSKWPPFWGGDEIVIGSDTGIWTCYKDYHEHLWHGQYLIDALTQIRSELLQFKIWLIWGPYDFINEAIHDRL